VADALAGLPPNTRARLERFSGALERLNVDDLPLYAVRTREPGHSESLDRAAAIANDAGLTAAIDAAEAVVRAYIGRVYATAQFRTSVVGMNTAPGLGPTEDRVRVVRSLGDAVTAIVLDQRLDESDQTELMGAWERLIP
jgi:hypothetical protein